MYVKLNVPVYGYEIQIAYDNAKQYQIDNVIRIQIASVRKL